MNNHQTTPVLLSCGILKQELNYIIREEQLQVEPYFLDSSLHIYFDRLEHALLALFEKFKDRPKMLIYGACHPLLERWCTEYHVHRIEAQNCIEMLLGKEVFYQELAAGAFFLMEDWARRWDEITIKALGGNFEQIKQLIREQHKYLCAVTTPCSGDYQAVATAIGEKMEMELKWRQSDLSYLKQLLFTLFRAKDIPG